MATITPTLGSARMSPRSMPRKMQKHRQQFHYQTLSDKNREGRGQLARSSYSENWWVLWSSRRIVFLMSNILLFGQLATISTTTAFVFPSSSTLTDLARAKTLPLKLPQSGFNYPFALPSSAATNRRNNPEWFSAMNTKTTCLWGTSNDNDDKKKSKNKSDSNSEETDGNDDESKPSVLFMFPEPVKEFGMKTWNLFVGLRWVLLSFVAGSIFAAGTILFPVYQSLSEAGSFDGNSVSQPVTLFETILADLQQGYVDPVDTNKLFETGISAMLRSLDPYTEYEGPQEAVELTESIEGRYGGVGLVISGTVGSNIKSEAPAKNQGKELQKSTELEAPQNSNDADSFRNGQIQEQQLQQQEQQKPISSSPSSPLEMKVNDNDGDFDEEDDFYFDDDIDSDISRRERLQEKERLRKKAQEKGIRVVNAFENYAFDYGMRVGDKLVAIDEDPLTPQTTVEDVRNKLRGEPGTMVSISFERDGVDGIQTISMPRSVISVRDVKLATLLGNPEDGIGYIQLSGFASDTGREMRNAIRFLQRASEDASNGSHSLKGLVLDLRGNPGGLLNSAVDVASLLVPNGSDIVSAKGRGFPSVLYRSRVDPILDPNTKLAVLVNRGTASAAEIVSGAVQDLDVGIIVGADRTFGKGLVQNVEELPFGTALKFTVAKYYTPSGRCIQGINYKEGGGLLEENGKYTATKISKKDRSVFYTKNGRVVRDGGGIEADFKVEAPKASALELILLRSGVMGEFAAEWSKKHELTNNFRVDEDTYRNFQNFVAEKQRSGDLQLEAIYKKSLDELRRTLKASGYKVSEREVQSLQASIVRDIQRDFEKYKEDIKEDISQSILARYLPERMLIERGVKKDAQVAAAVKLLAMDNRFDKLLARESRGTSTSTLSNIDGTAETGSLRVASSPALFK